MYQSLKKEQLKTKKSPSDPIFLQAEPFDSGADFKGFTPKKHDFMIAAYANKEEAKKRGEMIGYANIQHHDNGKHITPYTINVHPDYTRKGIGTKIYQMAEKASGKKLTPSGDAQSASAKKLWQQKNRPFG